MPKEKPELSDAMRAKMSRKLPEKNPIKGTKFRIAISIASNVYREIGVKLKKNKFIWYEGRIYITNFEKSKLTLKTFKCKFKLFKIRCIYSSFIPNKFIFF